MEASAPTGIIPLEPAAKAAPVKKKAKAKAKPEKVSFGFAREIPKAKKVS